MTLVLTLVLTLRRRPGSGKSTLAYPLADRVNELLLGHPVQQHRRATVDAATAVAKRPPARQPQPQAQPRAAPQPRQRRSSSRSSHSSRCSHSSHCSRASVTSTGDEVAICVGLDGWHHTRAELDAFPDPALAHWRRGAPWTFDLASYACFVRALRTCDSGPIWFPTFDHAAKDPAPSDTPILPQHRIVIVEGLYTMLDEDGWRDVAAEMDLRVWVEVPRDVVRARVLRRNTAAGIVTDDETARRRVEESDMVNGDEVYAHRFKVTDTIYPEDKPESPEPDAAPSAAPDAAAPDANGDVFEDDGEQEAVAAPS